MRGLHISIFAHFSKWNELDSDSGRGKFLLLGVGGQIAGLIEFKINTICGRGKLLLLGVGGQIAGLIEFKINTI